MAVTILAEPLSLVPAYNDIEYAATSNQMAQPNFSFYVVITNGADINILRVKPNINGILYINIKDIIKTKVRNYYPYGLSGWNEVLEAYKQITVNIGEEYGSTPTVHTGTNKTLKVWNGSMNFKERATYRPSQVYPFIWLNNYLPGSVYTNTLTESYRDQDLPFFFLDPAHQIHHVNIKAILATSLSVTVIGTGTINNSTSEEFICINLSPSSITTFLGGGTPFNGTENYYILDFCDSSGTIQSTITVRIKELCPVAVVKPRWLFYLNRFGAYDPIEMKLITRVKTNVDRVSYATSTRQAIASYLVGVTIFDGPNPLPINKKTLSTTYNRTATLASEWLTQSQVDQVRDLFTTPSAFIQEGYRDYTVVSPEAIEYNEGYELLDANIQITVPVNYGLTEGRQIE